MQLSSSEARRALALAVLLGGIIGAHTLTKTVRDAYFLAQLPATTLPYVYLGIAAIATVVVGVYTRLTWRLAPAPALAWLSFSGAAVVAVLGLLLGVGGRWLPIALYVWANVFGMVLMSQFWLFANSVSHAREAKRTFGIVGLGGIVGGLVGGLVAAPLAMAFSLGALLAVAAVLLALVVPVMFTIRREVVPADAPPGPPRRVNPLSHRYVKWLALAALCSVVVVGVVDYQFKVALQQRYRDPAALAAFFGQFYALGNLAAIGVQVFLTRWMIERMGASWSAAALPTGLALGSISTLFAPGVLATALTRLWDHVVRMSVNRPANEILFFPLEPGLRRRAKSLIDTGLERLGDALAGMLILAVSFAAGAGPRPLAMAVLAVSALWVTAWWMVRRDYVRELGRNLKRMNLAPGDSRVTLREPTLLTEAIKILTHPFERVVLFGIDMLLEHAPATLDDNIVSLLSHPSPAVRSRAMALVRERRLVEYRERVAAMVDDADEEVRVQAIATRSSLEGSDVLASLEQYLQAADPRLRCSAIKSSTEYASVQSDAALAQRLARLLDDGTVEDRRSVAGALGRRAAPSSVHELFPRLLRDADLLVRRSALRSAGRVGRRVDVPALIDALTVRPTQDAAREGLVAMGERVVGTLGDYLADPSVPIETRLLVPRVLGGIRTQDSVNALMRVPEGAPPRLDYRILKAANRIRSSGSPVFFPRNLVTASIERDVQAHLFAFVHFRSCPADSTKVPERMLCTVLSERVEQSLNRVFRRLALIYPPQEIWAAYRGFLSPSARAKGDAMEYLENALSPDHRAIVLPLVEDRGDEGRLALARTRYGIVGDGFDRTVQVLLEHGDPWLRACALFVVGRRKDRSLLTLVQSSINETNDLVRETATWAQLAILGG